MTTLIIADILSAGAVIKGVPTQSSELGDPDPLLDITFNCLGFGPDGEPYQGVLYGYATISGSKSLLSGTTLTAGAASISGTAIWGSVSSATLTAYATISGELLLEGLKKNWIAWSKIGSMDFTIDRTNVAGTRALDWPGWIYCVKKLGSKAVVYGENGVSFLIPSGVAYGLQTIHRIGLKSKNAVAGTEDAHFFIDNKDQLFSLSDGLEKLDYSEYLTVLTDPVLSFDIEANLLYICDGTYGFVYSPIDKSLGEGPVNVTGISSQGGTLYVAAPAAITTPVFEICTDIHDLGTRKNKTIFELEFGTNLEGTLQAAIYYRRDFNGTFTTTPWYGVTERGSVFITAMGREFMFRAKALELEYFEMDYLKINGIRHAH